MVVNHSNSLARLIGEQINVQAGESLFAVIDSAQDLELAFASQQLYGETIHTLFQGDMTDALADVAPYMTKIDLQKDYLARWQEQLGNNAGILFVTKQNDVDQLVQHLRGIFVVEDDTQQEYFFRFYDPRVMHSYLPTCNESELSEFFGPISRFFIQSEQPNHLTQYSIVENHLSTSEFPLLSESS